MEKSYWESRWVKNKIGFHTPEGEEALHKWWDWLVPQNQPLHVLIPLCGKSPDIEWIAQKGAQVTGIEFVEMACHDFFNERDIQPIITQHSFGKCFNHEGIDLWASDILKMPKRLLDKSNIVYDRAALVALPVGKRVAYVEKIASALKPGSRILLITFDYPQDEMNGPPFSIPEKEINTLHKMYYDITLLESTEILSNLKKFKEKGLSYLRKLVFLLERKHG